MAAATQHWPLMAVFRFEHCGGCYWYCPKTKSSKARCPSCREKIAAAHLLLEPCCRMIGRAQPFCMVVRPSLSSFKRYDRNCLLHIGVSNDAGSLVVDFDEGGVHRRAWPEALSVPLDPAVCRAGAAGWNRALEAHYSAEKERQSFIEEYHPFDNNCYSLVIRFLNSVEYAGSTSHSKEDVAVLIGDHILRFEIFFDWYSRLARSPAGIATHPPPPILCD